MVILGIDPGYAIVGYGAVSFGNCKFKPLGYGCIETSSAASFTQRIVTIYDKMSEILNKVKPDVVSMEKLYFQTNQKTAIYVAQARGVILLCAEQAGVSIYEYTPLQVKSAVTGYGKAQKDQVMQMTRRLLGLEELPRPDDAADALAVAICHAQAAGSTLRRSIVANMRP